MPNFAWTEKETTGQTRLTVLHTIHNNIMSIMCNNPLVTDSFMLSMCIVNLVFVASYCMIYCKSTVANGFVINPMQSSPSIYHLFPVLTYTASTNLHNSKF